MTTLGNSEEFKRFMIKHVLSGDSNVLLDCHVNQRYFQSLAERNEDIEQILFELVESLPEPRFKMLRCLLLQACSKRMRGAPKIARFLGQGRWWVRYHCRELGIDVPDGRTKE